MYTLAEAVISITYNKVCLQCFKLFTINDKSWTRAKEVCKALEYNKNTSNVIKGHCSSENCKTTFIRVNC